MAYRLVENSATDYAKELTLALIETGNIPKDKSAEEIAHYISTVFNTLVQDFMKSEIKD